MKFGTASLVGIEPMPFAELVQRSSALGIEALEVNVGPGYASIGGADYPGHLDLDAILRDGPSETLELVGRYGIVISALAPMLNLLTPDMALRETRIAAVRQAIDAAAALGVGTVVTYGGSAFGMHFWGLPGVGDNHRSNQVGENLRQYATVYAPLAAYAEDKGVRIAFETAPRGGGEGNIAHAPALWDRMFDAVPSLALGLSFDPSHLVWLHIPNIPDIVRRYGTRIYHFDGKDTEILPGKLAEQGVLGNGWWRYRLPGCGDLDWRMILAALRDTGYDGAVDIENEDPLALGLEGAAWSARHLRGLLP